MKILLVEDNEAMRTTLARTLGLRGLQVSTCADGDASAGRLAGQRA